VNLWIALSAALGGYLLGSLSFARRMIHWVAPGEAVERIALDLPAGGQITSDAVSATTVRLQLGPKYGCLTSLLDMLKAALPTLTLRLVYPEQPYFLIAAATVTAGHVWPLYHGLRGGRGQSPIIGGMLVIDGLGLLATNLAGALLGRFVFHSYLIVSGGYLVLIIPWLWFRTHDAAYLGYAVAINLINWTSRLPELRQYYRLKRAGQAPDVRQMAQVMQMGRGMGRWARRLGLNPSEEDDDDPIE
jgi:acyl phosphate:glycerol-3-phosphate acyltransferase